MRYAKDFVHYVSLSLQGLETTRLRLRPEINASNKKAVGRFIENVRAVGRRCEARKTGWYVWEDVPRDAVAELLDEFESDPLNFNFNMGAIAKFFVELTTRFSPLGTWH